MKALDELCKYIERELSEYGTVYVTLDLGLMTVRTLVEMQDVRYRFGLALTSILDEDLDLATDFIIKTKRYLDNERSKQQ